VISKDRLGSIMKKTFTWEYINVNGKNLHYVSF